MPPRPAPRTEIIVREDIEKKTSDPHPNAFYDAHRARLVVYHGLDQGFGDKARSEPAMVTNRGSNQGDGVGSGGGMRGGAEAGGSGGGAGRGAGQGW